MPNFFKNWYFDFIVDKISHQHTIKTQPIEKNMIRKEKKKNWKN